MLIIIPPTQEANVEGWQFEASQEKVREILYKKKTERKSTRCMVQVVEYKALSLIPTIAK